MSTTPQVSHANRSSSQPEPRGRTFAELDLLFERRVSARKFAKYEVDVFQDEDATHVGGNNVDQYEEMEKRASVVA
jgi:MFS transporter, SP family, general alpha glucoside:H+ symporter